MNEAQIKKLKERAINFEKIAKGLELDMKTIDMLLNNLSTNLLVSGDRDLNPPLNASFHLISTIRTITEVYR